MLLSKISLTYVTRELGYVYASTGILAWMISIRKSCPRQYQNIFDSTLCTVWGRHKYHQTVNASPREKTFREYEGELCKSRHVTITIKADDRTCSFHSSHSIHVHIHIHSSPIAARMEKCCFLFQHLLSVFFLLNQLNHINKENLVKMRFVLIAQINIRPHIVHYPTIYLYKYWSF